MSASDPRPYRPRSPLWRWGLWLWTAAAFACVVLSVQTPAPIDRVLRGLAGAFLIFGGVHQSRVVANTLATPPPRTTFLPAAILRERQAGWSAIILGAVLAASAFVAF